MDFHSLKRKQLQSLCKKHGIPANKTNLQMADLLTATLKAKGSSVPEEDSDEKIYANERNKDKKVRFSPDIETREYEPSAYRKSLKRSRKTAGEDKGEVVGDTTKQSSKGIARTASRRNPLAQLNAPEASDGQVVLKESRKRSRNLDLDVVDQVNAPSQTIKDVKKASVPAGSPRRSRRKISLLNSTLVSDEATGKALGMFELLNEKVTGKQVYVANQLRRSSRNTSRYRGAAMSTEMNEIAESVEVKEKWETVQKTKTTVAVTVTESLAAKPSRRSARHASKRDLVSGKKKQKSTSGLPTTTEETVFSNIFPPNVDTGLTIPGAAGEKRYSSLNCFNGLKNSKKRGESKSKPRGKRSNDPSVLNSEIVVEIDSATNLVKTMTSDSTEERALRFAGESVVVNENSVLVDDTGNLISGSSIEGGTYDECRPLETCANSDNNNSAELDLEEFHAKAGECSNVTGLEKVQGKSTSMDACHGSDDISCHSTEVDRINYQDGVCVVERLYHDDMKDGIEYRLVTENGRSLSSVDEEIVTGTNKDLFQETHDLNDHSTKVGRSIEENEVGGLERNKQNDIVDKKEHRLVAHYRKASLAVGVETFMEDTEDIHHECNDANEHSNGVQRNYVEKDRVSGLERTERNDSTDNQNDSFLAGGKIFLHVGKGTIQGAEDNEIVASGGHACDASEFSGSNCKYELEEGKGICQFAPEEKVANRGEHFSATSVALTSPDTICTIPKDNDEYCQASATELFLLASNLFVKSRKKYEDEKAIRTNLNNGEKDVSEGIQADALPQLYIGELEDGKEGNTTTPKNFNDKMLREQDLGDCVVFEREVGDCNVCKPLEASSTPTFLVLPSYKFNNYENTVIKRNCSIDAVVDEPVTQHNNLGIDMVGDQSMGEGQDVEQNEVEGKEECSMKVELVNCQKVAAKVNTSADSSFSQIICEESLNSHLATEELVSGKVVEVQLNAVQCEEVVREGITECAKVAELSDRLNIEEVAIEANDSGKESLTHTNFKESSHSGRKNAELMPQSSGNMAMIERIEEKELEFDLTTLKNQVESAFLTNKEVNLIHGNGEHVQVVDQDPLDNNLISRDSGQVMRLEQDHLEISERESLVDNLTSEDSGSAMPRKDHVASLEKLEQEEEIQFGKAPLSVTDEPTYSDDLGDMSAINQEDEQVANSLCAAREGGVAVKSSSFNGEENDALDKCTRNYGLDNLKEAENISYSLDQCTGENEVCEEHKDVGANIAGKSSILEEAADGGAVLLVFSDEASHEMAGTNIQKTKSSCSKWGASIAEISLHADSYCGKTEIDLGVSFTQQNEKAFCEEFERQMTEDDKVENGRLQRSGKDVNDPNDSPSLGNDDRGYHKSANELLVHQDTFNGVFLDNDFLDKLSCENESKIQPIEVGKEHCLHVINDEIVTVVADSKQTADAKNLDASSSCKSKPVINTGESETFEARREHCLQELDDEVVTVVADTNQAMDIKNLDASSPSKGKQVIDVGGDIPYHESQTLALNLFLEEGEHGVEKHGLGASQINLINKDAGEFITDLFSTQVAEDQHGEYEHQMDEVAHSKITNHAVSSEPNNEQSKELKMQDNVPANADVVLQGSIVCENEGTESLKIEHFYVAQQKVLMENANANSFPDAAPFEQTLKCEPSILRRGNSDSSIVEERREAMELIEDMTTNSERIVDQSLDFVSTGVIEAGDGQSCQLKSLSAKETSSHPENDKHDIYSESLTLSVMKRTRNRTGLILRTPQKVPDLHVMKENAPSMKREQVGSMTAPIPSLKRRPLEDLRKK